MKHKVILILVDGMRPDAVELSQNDFLRELAKKGKHTFKARTVMPSCTLPCHSSLFFSVDPQRHGITTNTWRPMVRPIDSLIDAIRKNDGKAGMFYNWEELRDLNRPGSLHRSYYQTIGDVRSIEEEMEKEQEMTNLAINYMKKESPDFLFLYLGYTDYAGHDYGWMEKEYNVTLSNAMDCIKSLWEAVSCDYQVIITADHGGHGRDHGYDIPEDMTIPIIMVGDQFHPETMEEASIKDIAPTIMKLLNIKVPIEWEGRPLY